MSVCPNPLPTLLGLLRRRRAGDLPRADASAAAGERPAAEASTNDAGMVCEMSPERFDVRRLIEELVDSVTPLVQQHNNNLTVTCADDVGLMFADQMMVAQILINLLDNAAKFTRNGWISIDVCRLTVRGRATVQFSVGDTGVGMTRQQTEIIFTPAGVAPSCRRGHGGKGLATVTRYCELMSGAVSVESHPGHGSTFFVHLPADVPLDDAAFSAPSSMARSA